MKNLVKKALSFLLVLTVSISVCVGLVGCNDGGKLTPEQIEQILQARRDKVESYMREQCEIIWKASEDFTYEITGGKEFNVKAGEYYLGLPYSYSGNTALSFLDYCSEPDEKGVVTLSGVKSENVGKFSTSNVGNDCSAALCFAWATINASIKNGSENTKYMCVDNGYLRVGEYTSNSSNIEGTQSVCKTNGKETMFKAYTELKKGDAIIHRDGSGHVRMIVSIDVKYKPNGSIDPYLSKVICLEQTRSNFGQTYFNEELGVNVNIFCGVDVAYTFDRLFQDGYLPITCKELRDASDIPSETINDSVKNANIDNLFTGEITSNYMIDKVKVQILDANGQAVQTSIVFATRYSYYKFEMKDFVELSDYLIVKEKITPSILESGEYSCKVTAYSVTGKEFTVRNFNFSK